MRFLLIFAATCSALTAPLPNTKPLRMEGDLSAQMVAGISRFLDREISQAAKNRPQFWKRDYRAADTYRFSIQKNREHFQFCIGATDPRIGPEGLDYIANTTRDSLRYKDTYMEIHAVRWPVFKGVHGEGLLITPAGTIRARVIAIPDADQTPEQLAGIAPGIEPQSQFARRLAVAGCQVVVPTLINRDIEHSGDPRVAYTNQTHREWIYRQAFEMGRHLIGYEVQKIQSVIDWFAKENSKIPDPPLIGVAGYHEGGLLALYTAALDQRIQATLVSGYFSERDKMWEEPIYRNVFGLLEQYGDAEIASMISPRSLIIEHAMIPEIKGPPVTPKGRRGGAAPGNLATARFAHVEAEYKRALKLSAKGTRMALITADDDTALDTFGSEPALNQFLRQLQVLPSKGWTNTPAPDQRLHSKPPTRRQARQIQELVDHTQRLLRFSEYERADQFWKTLDYSKADEWPAHVAPHKERFWKEVIGHFPAANKPINPRTRQIAETDLWTAHEVVLDVWDDVFAWGHLLVPKGIKNNEQRPVVVCQHGLEGLPEDTVTRDPENRSFRYYKGFAAELADRGFITFAPHNPYRGRDAFRELQRKANPLGRTLFSVIIPQHNRIIDWLETLPYVDKKRIGFYGLSYGGKTAMRVPALVPRYCLSICSADFNEWIKKNTTVDARYSYIFTGEYEIFEYNLGHTFNYAEMAALIAPRPFMVERGHKDGVAPDEWVAYEYAKVRRLYADLNLSDKTEIEYFQGPHTINGKATFDFLHRHLNWPKP